MLGAKKTERLILALSLITAFSSCAALPPEEADAAPVSVISHSSALPEISETLPPETTAPASVTSAAASTSAFPEIYTGTETVPAVHEETSDEMIAELPEELFPEVSDTAADIQTASLKFPAKTTAKKTEAASKTSAKKKDPVIPEVKVPSAPGKDVLNGKHSKIDYSNSSEGYIAASCSGSGAAVKLRVTCGSLQYDHDMVADGKVEYIPLMGSGKYTVKMYEQFSGKKFAEVLNGSFDAKVKDDTVTYLYPNKYVNFSKSSECVKKAAELCDGKKGDIEKIAAIFDYIAKNITYDKKFAAEVKDGYIPDPDRTLSSKKGICFDYSSLFAAMCRSQGIPARIVVGYADPNIYHAWNEIYTAETGWITPEVFLKKKGYNRTDATFYTGRSDKKKAAEYISDEKNYSAMYRY